MRSAFLALVLAGCSSTLAGFHCETEASCGGALACIDGACAALDSTCSSGSRWDGSAGARAGHCATTDSPDGGTSTMVGGEALTLGPGVTAMLLRDLSNDYTYDAADFVDSGDTYDNAPRAIVSLDAPFVPGFAVLVGRALLELAADGQHATLHDFTPPAASTGSPPDHPVDLAFAATVGGTAGVLLESSVSEGPGDGVFSIASDWTLARAHGGSGTISDADCASVAFDGAGSFDGSGAAQLYYQRRASSGAETVRRASDGVDVFSDPALYATDLEVTHSGLVAILRDDGHGTNELAMIASPNAKPASIEVSPLPLRLVTGALDRLPAGLHVVDGTRLVSVAEDGTSTALAATTTPSWQWVAAAVPLTGTSVVYYVLESNRTLGLDRVLAITTH